MLTPAQEQDSYDFTLAARIRNEIEILELDVEKELNESGTSWDEEVSFAERLYALRSDNKDLQKAIVSWHNDTQGEDLFLSELRVRIEADPSEWE